MSRIASRPIASLAFVVALALLLLNAVRVAVQGPDDFFDGQVLQRIDLYINSDDWRQLQTDITTRAYHPAMLKWGNIVSRNVGVQSESPGASAARKPRLHVDVSWYVSSATFLGLQSFTLDDLAEDPSAVRRTVTLRFYQWMDLPAPRVTHAALYVNGAYFGLYAVAEPLDRAMARYAGAHGLEPGRLYRYALPAPYQLNYLGTDLKRYEELFRAERDQAGFRSDDYTAIEEMIRALNNDVISSDERRLSTYVDARQFVKIAAVQNFLGMPAGLVGRDGLTDFSLHVRRPDDAVQFVPHGESAGLVDPSYPIEQGLSMHVRTRFGIRLEPEIGGSQSTLSATYLRALLASAAAADKRDDVTTSSSLLSNEVDRQQRLIAEAVRADSLQRWTEQEFKDASSTVRRFARERAGFVRCRVAALLQQSGACGGPAAAAATAPSAVSTGVPSNSAQPGSDRGRTGVRPGSDPTTSTAVPTGVRSNSILSSQAVAAATNVARGRPYTLAPRPNYPLTSDAGDDTQLTDGAFTAGTLWTHATTVGWANAVPVTIVIDLGNIQPISGVSYSTAAGTAGVSWPRSIFVLVSDDGQRFFAAGDLAAQAAAPPSTEYSAFRFGRTDLKTHGRYVALIVDPDGSYTFCDEIEVLSGDPAWIRAPLSGESTADLKTFFGDARTRVSIQRRLTADLGIVRSALESFQIAGAERARLTEELRVAENEIAAIPTPARDSFKTVLPLNATHARIFAVHGQAAQARGLLPLTAWVVNPWEFVRPLDEPPAEPGGPGTVTIAAMTGETRSGAINLANSTGRSMKVTLSLDGWSPVDSAGSQLRLYEAIWTDTRELIPVAAALVPLSEGTQSVDLPAGMTRQIWISFTPLNRGPRTIRGRIEARSDDGFRLSVPFELRILSGMFPARPTLHVGGWDYTDADQIYGLTLNNRDLLIQQLRQLNVDSTWARGLAMPAGTFDAAGHLTTPPDTSLFDRWISRWPGASRYMVFVNGKETLGNVPTNDARFPIAAAEWIRFWTAHAAALGIQPSQLMLLLVDEPRSTAQDERVVTWAKAIKAGDPRVRIWEDPTYTDPAASMPQLLGVADVLALKRSLMLQQGAPFVDFYRQRRARGQSLDVYATSGRARLLDPYTYYRLQAWACADVGASGSFFWSFVDDADGSSWNEYSATQILYSPFFLSNDAVTISKHTEAIREGVEDFEYLAMLRDRVALLSQSDPNHAGLPAAVALLDSATATVLGASGASDLDWVSNKDRSAADTMRLAIADLLEKLQSR